MMKKIALLFVLLSSLIPQAVFALDGSGNSVILLCYFHDTLYSTQHGADFTDQCQLLTENIAAEYISEPDPTIHIHDENCYSSLFFVH